MFPVDAIPPQYCEERIAADEAKRSARDSAIHQRQLALEETRKQIHQMAASSSAQQQYATSSSLSQALQQQQQQRPTLSRPASSGFLGNVFQGFVRARSTPPATPSIRTPSPSNQRQLGDGAPVAAISSVAMTQTKGADPVAELKKKRDQDLACFMGRA